jgi:hypothetical protein
MRRLALILALLCSSFSAAADTKEELQSLYAALSSLTQEQQSVFQQFQMLQELRRANEQAFFNSQIRASQFGSEIPSYADVIQQQKDVVRHGEALAQQADQLYAQYSEIAARKSLLQQRIFELTLPR